MDREWMGSGLDGGKEGIAFGLEVGVAWMEWIGWERQAWSRSWMGRIVDRDPACNPPGWNMVGRCHSRGTTIARAYFRRSQETFTPLLSYY